MERTLVNLILDETGSMEEIKTKTISGVNEYLKSLGKHGDNVRVSLTKFNSNTGVRDVFTDMPISKVSELTNDSYRPDGLTPLYDAIGRKLKETDDILAKLSDSPDVLTVIITDGMNNDSREFARDQIFKMIREREDKGWTFMYLGSNQDSWIVSEGIGMKSSNVMNYAHTDRGMARAFACTSLGTERYFARAKAFHSSGGVGMCAGNNLFDDLDEKQVEELTSKIEGKVDSWFEDKSDKKKKRGLR